MLPVSREQDPYIEVLDLKFEPVFYLRSYFKNFNIKIKGEKLEEYFMDRVGGEVSV